MNKELKHPLSLLSFFRIPFEKGSLKLTIESLNKHSDFRRTERPYFCVSIRKIAYQNEILVIGVTLQDEAEEKVYLQVKATELRISCSVDTHENHLSRYAYFALNQLIYVYDHYDFEKYYWPDFFNQQTGKSKYLNVINDRSGLDVFLKPKYTTFYKPGQRLIFPIQEKLIKARQSLIYPKESIYSDQGYTMGYCIADTLLRSWHSNHLPFLIPYSGLLTNNKDAVKGYVSFITEKSSLPPFDYTMTQHKLHNLCFKMMELAPIKSPVYKSTRKEEEDVRKGNLRRRDKLFLLWQEALPLLECQLFTNHYHTYGMKNVVGKPRRKDMQVCTFSMSVPRICFLWQDKGEYYELSLRFKIDHRTLEPTGSNIPFFISAKADPKKFYLLENLTDFSVVAYFEKRNFHISVLKNHYKEYFQCFKEQLAKVYDFASSAKKSG